uniref:Transmembrane protein 44 n=1 Tax=Mus musculus TaxID=10090 RepID=Q8CD41_MOUSE|nr:unnamed protein product [Mus musculus]
MEEGASAAPPLLNWDYLERCFARRRVCISFGLWICAACCWIAAHTLILYLRCTKKCSQDQSTLCAAFCLLTSLCDTVGAILARQLTIQVFTGAYLAAVDFMNFMFTLFPVCGSKSKSKSGQSSRERRRRHLRASVFALALPLSLGPGWAIWTAIPKAPAPVRGPQRRLLGSLLQENPEVFGYLLGAIAAFGSWASRIPPFSNIVRLGWGWGYRASRGIRRSWRWDVPVWGTHVFFLRSQYMTAVRGVCAWVCVCMCE